MLKRTLAMLLVSLIIAAPLWGAETRRELVNQSTLEQIVGKNRMRVGFSTFVPWAMKDKQGGYTGFEIEVARQLAEDMGVEIDFVPTKWSGIIPALLTGKFDIIIGGMGITPERNLKVNFSSIPGFQYTPLIVGLVVSGVILLIAAILASIPKKPEMKVSFQDTSMESLNAQRRMLKESIADVERLRKSGEVTGDAYLARLKRLRADLADNESAFKKLLFEACETQPPPPPP